MNGLNNTAGRLQKGKIPDTRSAEVEVEKERRDRVGWLVDDQYVKVLCSGAVYGDGY